MHSRHAFQGAAHGVWGSLSPCRRTGDPVSLFLHFLLLVARFHLLQPCLSPLLARLKPLWGHLSVPLSWRRCRAIGLLSGSPNSPPGTLHAWLSDIQLSGFCPREETCGHCLRTQASLPPAFLSLSFLPGRMKGRVNESSPSDGKTHSGPVMS